MATRGAVTTVSSDKSDVAPEPRTTNRVRLGNPLLLTNFSPNAERALPYAVALAQQYTATTIRGFAAKSSGLSFPLIRATEHGTKYCAGWRCL